LCGFEIQLDLPILNFANLTASSYTMGKLKNLAFLSRDKDL